jgi:tetratricopeptide (TPR) repeat protein
MQLRIVGQDIEHGRIASGLESLNRLAGKNLDPARKTQVLAAIGDAQLQRLDYHAAGLAYAKAERAAGNHPRAWLRPAIGQVITALKNLQTEAAWNKAQQILDTAINAEQGLATAIDQAEQQLASGKPASFDGLPHRHSYVGSRLGNLFLQEGYAEMAAALFRKTLEYNPNGATRCRIGLAEIDIQHKDWVSAHDWAISALQIGKFRAKTLSAIALYLKATVAIGASTDLTPVLDGFLQSPRGVRDRAYYEIVLGLRNHRVPAWTRVAKEWLAMPGRKDSIIETEILKVLLADAKLTPTDALMLSQRAKAVLHCENLQFSEWSFAARERLKVEPQAALELIADGIQRYGHERRHAIVHRLARAAFQSGNESLARQLLTQGLSDAPKDRPGWGRMASLLAKIEESAGNFSAAAAAYWAIYAQGSCPERIRLITLLSWARNAMRGGQTAEILQRRKDFEKAISQITDYALLLDMARHAGNTSLEFQEIALTTLAKGTQLAHRLINVQSPPAAARQAWFVLTRRLIDFGRNSEITDLWEGISEELRDRIWSSDDNFWSGLEFVVRAYGAQGRFDEAITLAEDYIDHSAAPPHGIARLATHIAFLALTRGDFASVWSRFDQAIKAAPTHPITAHAYYWKSVLALSQGDRERMKASGAKIVFCVGQDPGILSERMLRYQGALLQHNLDFPAASSALGAPLPDFLNAAYESIQEDTTKVRA